MSRLNVLMWWWQKAIWTSISAPLSFASYWSGGMRTWLSSYAGNGWMWCEDTMSCRWPLHRFATGQVVMLYSDPRLSVGAKADTYVRTKMKIVPNLLAFVELLLLSSLVLSSWSLSMAYCITIFSIIDKSVQLTYFKETVSELDWSAANLSVLNNTQGLIWSFPWSQFLEGTEIANDSRKVVWQEFEGLATTCSELTA